MREITGHRCGTGMDEHIRIEVANLDTSPGGACAAYQFYIKANGQWEKFARVDFQKGPAEGGPPSGLSNEALLAVVADRLQGFQAGKYPCRENAHAVAKIEEALHWLHARTRDRAARGIEGTLLP